MCAFEGPWPASVGSSKIALIHQQRQQAQLQSKPPTARRLFSGDGGAAVLLEMDPLDRLPVRDWRSEYEVGPPLTEAELKDYRKDVPM